MIHFDNLLFKVKSLTDENSRLKIVSMHHKCVVNQLNLEKLQFEKVIFYILYFEFHEIENFILLSN